TAVSTVLGLIPIAVTVFWGPMAYAVMGGLLVATVLTLIFLPVLYIAWFRIKDPGVRDGHLAGARGGWVASSLTPTGYFSCWQYAQNFLTSGFSSNPNAVESLVSWRLVLLMLDRRLQSKQEVMVFF